MNLLAEALVVKALCVPMGVEQVVGLVISIIAERALVSS